MTRILHHISDILQVIALSIPVIILLRMILRKKTTQINWFHETGLVLFASYLVGLFSQTFVFNLQRDTTAFRVNLTPLNKLTEFEYIVIRDGNLSYFFIEILGNILMFSVIGFLLPLLFQKLGSAKRVILLCFLTSLTIELIQLALPRGTDIDDILMNTLGGILGYALYRLFYKLFPKGMARFHQNTL